MATVAVFHTQLMDSAIQEFSNDVFGAASLLVVDDRAYIYQKEGTEGACLTKAGVMETVNSMDEGWLQSEEGKLLPDGMILGRVCLTIEVLEDGAGDDEGHP